MARKRYQRGSVSLVGKAWVGRYREDQIGSDGVVRRLRRAVVLGTKRELPTKRLAERRLEVHLAPINSFSYRPGRMATVAEFSERWQVEVLSKRKDSTIHSAKAHLRNQIIPHLGKLPLDQLGVENQQAFVSRITGTVAHKTLLNIIGTLSSMLTTAKNWGYVCDGVSLTKLVLPPREVKKRAPTFTADQARDIIATAPNPFRVMFALAAMAGLRGGEIVGLRVGDFDFQRREMWIRRSARRGKIQTVKSEHSEAVLPMPEPLSLIVRAHIESLPAGQEALFLNKCGRIFNADKVVQNQLWPVLDRLTIPRCGLHAFRHTHTSLLLNSGAPVPVTQAQLRHSDARVTLGVYGHIVGDAHREAVDKVASILDSNGLKDVPVSTRIQ